MESHLARPLKLVTLTPAEDTVLSSGTRQFAIWGENNPSSLSIPVLGNRVDRSPKVHSEDNITVHGVSGKVGLPFSIVMELTF